MYDFEYYKRKLQKRQKKQIYTSYSEVDRMTQNLINLADGVGRYVKSNGSKCQIDKGNNYVLLSKPDTDWLKIEVFPDDKFRISDRCVALNPDDNLHSIDITLVESQQVIDRVRNWYNKISSLPRQSIPRLVNHHLPAHAVFWIDAGAQLHGLAHSVSTADFAHSPVLPPHSRMVGHEGRSPVVERVGHDQDPVERDDDGAVERVVGHSRDGDDQEGSEAGEKMMPTPSCQEPVTELLDGAIGAWFDGKYTSAIALAGAAEASMPNGEGGSSMFCALQGAFTRLGERPEKEVVELLSFGRDWLKHFDESRSDQTTADYGWRYITYIYLQYRLTCKEAGITSNMKRLNDKFEGQLQPLREFSNALTAVVEGIGNAIAVAPPPPKN